MRRRRDMFIPLAILAPCSLAAPVRAQHFAANTFSGNFQYEILAGSTISGAEVVSTGYTDTANKFTAAYGGQISDIWVAMAHNAGPNIFDMHLREDANNSPGAIIQTWTLVDQAFPFDPNYHPPVHVAVTDPAVLIEGAPYWLEMHAGAPDAWLVWDFTRPPLFENVAQRLVPDGTWNVLSPGFTSSYAVAIAGGPPACYANCDASTAPPLLNINDFICFQIHFAMADRYANCDGSTTAPIHNVNDFLCFTQLFVAGCP